MIWGVFAEAAAAGAVAAKAEHDAFIRSIAGLPPDERRRRIDRRQDRMDADRRHREMVEAARPSQGGGALLGAGVIGFILGMGAGK